ncbi:MAG: hypothetical protein LCH67_08310 [Bacteroidetes bacterium]|nr:hypothetical protein [Bacteroidota bacterium]
MNIIFVTLLTLSFACKEQDLIGPATVSLAGKVEKLSLSLEGKDQWAYTLSYDKNGLLSSYKTLEGTQYLLKADSLGKLQYKVAQGSKDTLRYKYNTRGLLVEIKSTKIEKFDYDNQARPVYYVRSVVQDKSTIYEQTVSNTWEGGQLVSQISSVPGKTYEEETAVYTTEANPLKEVLDKAGNFIQLKEIYAVSPLLPKLSAKLFEGLNLRYDVVFNDKKQLTDFIIKKETLNGLVEYQRIKISYYLK